MRWFLVTAALSAFCTLSLADQVLYPLQVRQLFSNDSWKSTGPYNSVGLVSAEFAGGMDFLGSGAVAKDRKLVFSCAHLAYDKGRWASRIGFARAYDDFLLPDKSADIVYARGFRVLAGYAPRPGDYDFDVDFIVAYLLAGFGEPLACHPSPKSALESEETFKRILGYPSLIDYLSTPGNPVYGYSYLHQTGPFSFPFYPEQGSYMGVGGISTGPGNSGGPLLLDSDGQHLLAGILVSGDEASNSSGVFVLDNEAESVAESALGKANLGTTRSFFSGRGLSLSDAAREYKQVRFDCSKMPSSATKVVLRWRVSTVGGLGIKAFLRSPEPGGVTVILPEEKVLSGWDLSKEFAGHKADGVWTLHLMKDDDLVGPCILRYASLTLSSRD